MHENWYIFGIESLNFQNLEEFYTSIYQKEIAKKNNAHVIDLIDRLKNRIGTHENIQFAFIKKDNKLLAWWIFILKIDNGISIYNLWYRGYEKIKIQWLFLWYYIEYLFYKRAIESKADFIWRWKDRNCYGSIWSGVGLPIHKLQYKFLPYCLDEDNPEIFIDEASIQQETLIFTEPNEEYIYTKAILYTNRTSQEIQKEFAVIEKRWIYLEIRKFIDLYDHDDR